MARGAGACTSKGEQPTWHVAYSLPLEDNNCAQRNMIALSMQLSKQR